MNRYRIQAKGPTRAELLIYGDIGDDWLAEESNDARTVVSRLQELGASDIDVRINSYGGVVADGLAIYNALQRHPSKVTTHIDGVAFSIASLIAMGGSEVRMADNALLMIHAPWGMSVGNAAEMRDMADTLDKFAQAMTTAYLRDQGPDEARISGWLTDGEDHYFTASEAADIGLIDAVTDSIDIAAALRGAERFKLPAAHAAQRNQEANVATPHEPAGGSQKPEKGTPETKDYLDQHKSAVNAGVEKGAQAENQRQQKVRALFYTDAGAFAYGDDSDPADPMVALMNRCLEDIRCDETKALREINAAHRAGYRPIGNPLDGAQPHEGSSYARSARAPGVQRLGGWSDAAMIADQSDKFVAGATEALEVRCGLETDPAKVRQARGSEYLSMSVSDLCKAQLQMQGRPVSGNREDIIRRVLAAGPGQGTDHFTAILENIANKSIMDRFENAEETWGQWTEPGTLNDYREASRVNKSLFDALDKMIEHDAFRHGRFADVKQSITGYLYGKEFSLTLQAMVNDDLSMLTDDMGAWGEAASKTIGDAVWAVIQTAGTGGYGQTMDEDSTLLFHADHSNYVASGSGGAPAKATIAAGRTAMMTQTDPNSRVVASRPRYLLHGTTLTPTVWELLNSFQMITGADTTAPDRNWVASTGLTSVEEYRFDSGVSTAWILAAARRTVEVAFVQGQRTPRVDRMPTSNIPGVSWQISIPFGVAALDYRTMYLNYGA